MPIRESLPPVLRGAADEELSPEARAALEALAREAQAEGLLVFMRDECAGRLRQPHPSPRVEYLLAAACALNGEFERAGQTLLALGEKLALSRHWEPLAAVAERSLDLRETAAAAHLLVRAHEGLGRDPERIAAIERALAILPDDLDLGLLLAVRLGEAGEGERRRALLTELMPRFAAEGRWSGLEEAALEFVEHGAIDGLVRLLQTLPAVAEKGANAEARALLEIAFPPVAAAGRAAECLDALRAAATRAAEDEAPDGAEPWREPLVEALRQGPARALPDPDPVLSLSGLEDRMKPVVPSLQRFDAIAALPPGRAVLHDAFGAGHVIANDGEIVITDFARSRGHRMPYAAALRTLTAIAEDDLRLLRATDPAQLARLRAEEPGEIVVRALISLGGAADAQKLKQFLVGSDLVPAADWTGFWRRARAAAEKDARIDHARAFEQHYRLTPEVVSGAPPLEIPLPPMEPRKPVKSNLSTLRKFLAQHPDAESALAQRFGRFIERAMLDPDGERADRARAGLHFARWFPERVAEWHETLRALWKLGLEIGDLPSEDDQLALLEASHAAGVDADAILSALDSRFAAVRETAGTAREHLDDAGRSAMRDALLRQATRYPAAALRLIEQELSGAPAEPWRLLWATLSLLEDRPRPSVAEKALGWIERGGRFDQLGVEGPCPEDLRLRIRVLLRQWRSSDRYLFPALEAADRLGLGEEAAAVRASRARDTEKLFSQVGKQAEAVDIPVMTRATWERLSRELERLERELRTTIPQTIQRARELGDLKENAEYHSAKLKQSVVSKQVASLQLRLARARFVDDAALQDGVVGLGTEVVLESETDMVTYWILGDSEHHHGGHVVSFQAPLGRALMGRAIGDEVELGEGDQRRRYRVISVERRLPPVEGAQASEGAS